MSVNSTLELRILSCYHYSRINIEILYLRSAHISLLYVSVHSSIKHNQDISGVAERERTYIHSVKVLMHNFSSRRPVICDGAALTFSLTLHTFDHTSTHLSLVRLRAERSSKIGVMGFEVVYATSEKRRVVETKEFIDCEPCVPFQQRES